MKNPGRFMKRLLQGAVAVAVAMSVPAGFGAGNGTSVQVTGVAAGMAAMSRVGAVTTVRTGTERTIINYSALSVGAGDTLNFVQPSVNSRVLNRIEGTTPTRIDGTLLSNGQVYLVNPSGVMFGKGAVVNAAGLFAAAGHISNADFLAGNNAFTGNSGTVRNEGMLTAAQVHLVGLNVENFGQVVAGGTGAGGGGGGVVTMTAGKDVYIGETSSPTGGTQLLVKVSADGIAGSTSVGVNNAGKVEAANIHMGAGDLYAAGIYNSGTLKGHAISLNAGANTAVTTGTIDAHNANGTGGSVAVLGKKVGVFGGTVDASGSAGGGEVLIGGDQAGSSARGVPVSEMAVVSDGATVRADGTGAGANGGRVIVYSSGVTEVGGQLSTLNGPGGAGGLIETSGLVGLLVKGAPQIGMGGTWLLDPFDITINNTGPTTDVNQDLAPSVPQTFTALTSAAVISQGDINTALGNGDVVITTTLGAGGGGSVNWVAGADMAYNFGGTVHRTLTIQAQSFISLNSNIGHTGVGSDALAIVLSSAGGDVSIAANIDTNGEAFSSSGRNFSILSGSIQTHGGNANILHTGLVSLSGPFNIGGGAMVITGTSVNETDDITADSLLVVSNGGVNLSENNAINHFTVIESGSGSLVILESTTALSLSASGTLTSSLNGGTLVLLTPGLLTIDGAVDTHGGNQRYIANDFVISASLTAGAGLIAFEGTVPTETVGVGTVTGKDITLDNTELGHIVSAGSVRIGGPSQTGNIELGNVDLHALSAAVTIQTTGTGVVKLTDNGTGPALAAGGDVTILGAAITATSTANAQPEIASGGLITLTATGAVGATGSPIQIDSLTTGTVNVTAGGAVVIDGLGSLTFGSISAAGNTVDVTSGGEINATGAIAGTVVNLTAVDGIGTGVSGPINLDATVGATLTTTAPRPGGFINIIPVGGTTPPLTFVTDPGSQQTITITKSTGLVIGGNVVAGPEDVVVIQAGASGVGNLSFSGSPTISADFISLLAGKLDGSASASVVDFTNVPVLENGGGTPSHMFIEQDATITDAPVAVSAYPHGIPFIYQIASLGGSTTISSAADVAGCNLVLQGRDQVTVNTNLTGANSVFSLVTLGNTTLQGNVTASAGQVTIVGDLLIKQDTTLTGVTLITTGNVTSENGRFWTLTANFSGLANFRANVGDDGVHTAGTELGALDLIGTGMASFGNGIGAGLNVRTKEDVLTNPTADGHITINEDVMLADNLTFSAAVTHANIPGFGDVTFGGVVQSTALQAFSLAVATSGVTWFKQDLGGGTNQQLGAVFTDQQNGTLEQTHLGSGGSFNVTAVSPIVFGDNVVLLANTVVTAPGATGNVTFGGTVVSQANALWTLTVNAGAATTFKKDVGDNTTGQLGFLKTDAAGTASLGNGGTMAIYTKKDAGLNAASTGEIAILEPVTLGAELTLTAAAVGGISTPTDDVTLGQLSTTGGFGITVNTAGTTWFKGGASTGQPVNSITTDAGGTTVFGVSGAQTVSTVGAQVYGDTVIPSGKTTFAGSSLTFNGTPSITAGLNDLVLQSDVIVFGGGANSVQGSGSLTLKPTLLTDGIIVGTTGSHVGTLNLSLATLAALQDGFMSITIGSLSGAHAITVASDSLTAGVVFNDPVFIQAPAGGSILVNSPVPGTVPGLYGAGDAVVVLQAGAITLNSSVMSNGNGIAVIGAVTLGSPGFVTLKSYGTDPLDLTSAGALGGAITVVGNVSDDGVPTQFRVDAAGTVKGNIDLQGSVGAGTAVDGFTAKGADLKLHGDVRTTGAAPFAGVVSITTDTVTLAGNANPALATTLTIDTDASGGTGNGNAVNMMIPVDRLAANGPVSLVIDTSAAGGHAGGNISLGSVGASHPLAALTLTAGTGNVTLLGATTTGAFASSGGTFGNTFAITANGINIHHTGLVTLAGALIGGGSTVTASGQGLTTTGSGSVTGGNILLDGGTGVTSIGRLVTGTGLVTIAGGAFGNGATITGFDVTLNVGGVATLGANITADASAGTLRFNSNGVTQSAGVIMGHTLQVAGTGTFLLNKVNQVGTLQAAVAGPLTFVNGPALLMSGLTAGVTDVTAPTVESQSAITVTSLTVHGNFIEDAGASVGQNLITVANDLMVTGNATFGDTVNVGGSVVVGASVLEALQGISAGGSVTVAANYTAHNGLTAGGNIAISGSAASAGGLVSATGVLSVGVDLNGSGTFSAAGDIGVGRDLTVTSAVIHAGHDLTVGRNADITGVSTSVRNTVISGDLNIQGTLSSGGSTSVGGNAVIGTLLSSGGDVTVGGAASGTGSVVAVGNITIGGGYSVQGATTSTGGSLLVTGPVSITSGITVTTAGGVTVHNTFDLAGDLHSGGFVQIDGLTHITGSVVVSQLGANFGSSLTVTGPMTVNGPLNISADAVFGGQVTTTVGGISIGGNSSGDGAMTAAGPIRVFGQLSLGGPTSAGTTLEVDVGVNVATNVAISSGGDMTLSGPVNHAGTIFSGGALHVGLPAVIVGDVVVAHAATFGDTVNLGGKLTAGGGLSVGTNAVFGAAVAVSGGDIVVGGRASGVGSMTATGNIHVGSLTLAGATNAGGQLIVDGPVSMFSGTTLTSGTDMQLNGPVILIGNLQAGTALTVGGTAQIQGNVTAGTTATFQNDLQFSGVATSGGAFAVSGNLALGDAVSTGVIVAGGAFTVGGSLSGAGSITATGSIQTGGIGSVFSGPISSTQGSITIGGGMHIVGLLSAPMGSIDVQGNLRVAGSVNAGTTLAVGGPLTVDSSSVITAGGDMQLMGGMNYTGTLDAGGAIHVAGSMVISGGLRATQAFDFTGAGPVTLAGTFTAQSLALPAVVLTGPVVFTSMGAGGMSLGAVTGAHAVTFTSNDAGSAIMVGAIGTGAARAGAVSFNSANVVQLDGDIYAGNVVFGDQHGGILAAVPQVATITAPHGNLLIDTTGTFEMKANQKLTVVGDLTISTAQQAITLGDVSALGKILVTTNDRNGPVTPITVVWRVPQQELGSNGGLTLDTGTDIVAGFNGLGAIDFRGVISVPPPASQAQRVTFSAVNATSDITAKAGVMKYNGQDNLSVVSANVPAGQLIVASDFFAGGAPGGAVLDLVKRGNGSNPDNSQGSVVPRDVQSLQPERNQVISGALKEALSQLGVFARDLNADELVDYLVGRAMYNDVPLTLNPEKYQVASNRLPYSPVKPTVDAFRNLFLKQELDAQGNPVVEDGKPKMVSQDAVILTSFGVTWQAYMQDKGDAATPAGFRGYLESHEKDEDKKFATALDYLNQLRKLLLQIQALGLTQNEVNVSREVLLKKVRPPNIHEEDFLDVVNGPSTRTGGTAMK